MKNKLLRQKSVVPLLAAIATTLYAVPSQSAETDAPYWSCVDPVEYFVYSLKEENWPATVVKVWTTSEPLTIGKNTYSGTVEANGIRQDAVYYREGLEHRWDFDWNQDKDRYMASFIINPEDTGLYYFFGDEDPVEPSLITKCKKFQ